MAELCKLTKTCNFGSYLDTALHDQLVCGQKDPRIQHELLCVQKLTVAQALERARAMEVVAKEAKHLQFEGGNTEAHEAPTHQMSRTKNSSATDVEALTTWQQNALIRTSFATNATKLDT